jgi:glycerol uptake facilitator-like aquaporin
VAQIIGGCLGTLGAHVMFDVNLFQVAETARTGVGPWFAEFVATFGLIATILGCIRFNPYAVATAMALYITAAQWFTASTSFANPAVTIARSLTNTYTGIAPRHVPAFIVAELIGAVVAAALFGWLFEGRPAASRRLNRKRSR